MARKRFASDDDLPWYRYRWAWFVWLGPALVVVASFITLYIAIINADTIVDPAYYKSGKQAFIDTRKQEVAVLRGYRATAAFNPDHTQLQVILRGIDNNLPDSLILKMQHPTVADWDFKTKLEANGIGIYRAQVKIRKATHWFVSIEDESQQWEIRTVWKPSEGDSFLLDPKVTSY